MELRASRSRWLLGLYSLAFLAWTAVSARVMRLWFDELITVELARLSGPVAIWRALEAVVDGMPPLGHVLVQGLVRSFGASELVVRSPSIVGFWVMQLCLYVFVARRCGAAYAWLALLTPLATPAALYAIEARPYGLVLGLAGVALIAWQTAAGMGRWRLVGVAGLALAVAAAVSSHYYAVLILIPLGLGEAVRTIERRRVDLPVWLALGIGAVPLALLWPLASKLSQTVSRNFFGKPSALSLPAAYSTLFAPLIPALVALVLLVGWRWVRWSSNSPRADDPPESPPRREWVVAAGFLALPVVVYFMAVCVTGAWVLRYLLPATMGAGILLAFVAQRLAAGRPGPAWLGAVLLFLAAAASVAGQMREQAERFRPPASLVAPLRFAGTGPLPIVVCNPDLYLQMVHYSPMALQGRLLYISGGQNTAELHLERLTPFAPVRVERFEPFWVQVASSAGPFILYGRTDDWLLAALIARGARVQMRFVHENRFVAVVEGPN